MTNVKPEMLLVLSQPNLMLNGKMLSNESKFALVNVMQMGLAYAKLVQNEKSCITRKGNIL